jgi:RNA-directed DNA polymerase
MNGNEEPDPIVVAIRTNAGGMRRVKPTNKAGRPVAEPVERRVGTKGNASQHNTRRAQNRESVTQALDRVRQAARTRKKERFTALLHHVDVDLLRIAFLALQRGAAPGADGLTWRDYEADLEPRLVALHKRVQRGAYRPQPSRRTYIPKADGKQRPLAIGTPRSNCTQSQPTFGIG